jgi:hypothetical protein
MRSVNAGALLVGSALMGALASCGGGSGTAGRPLHAAANFDPSLPGWVACSRLIVEGDVVSVRSAGTRMITELAVDDWVKPASGPTVARIETTDIAEEGVYDHWKPGRHLFLHVDADPTTLPSWQFKPGLIKKIKAAVPASRALTCPYGTTDSPLMTP